MDYSKTGTLIAMLRKQQGLTQLELANKLNVTDRAISKWECGKGCPDVSSLEELSKILNVSIIEILKGRRLNNEEIISNESVVESMNYSKSNLKYKIKNSINYLVLFIVTAISLSIIFFNLKSFYLLNKTYKNNSYDSTFEETFALTKKYINTIRNDQGLYSTTDYGKITLFINELEANLNVQRNEYYYNKLSYNYRDLIDYYLDHNKNYYSESLSNPNDMVYGLLHEYDKDVIDNMFSYNRYNNYLVTNHMNIAKELSYPYYNDKSINKNIVDNIASMINFTYKRDNMLLKDIIEVGEINE